jgi:hypothetical protein
MNALLLTCLPLVGSACDTVPPVLNQAIVAFVTDHFGQRVGGGECWDLAAQALDGAQARWDGAYLYGKPVDPLKECVYPGDIIRFQKVTIRHFEDGRTTTERMSEHTAIILEVRGPATYVVGHQNTSDTGRKVGSSTVDLHHVVSGKYTVFRPQR